MRPIHAILTVLLSAMPASCSVLLNGMIQIDYEFPDGAASVQLTGNGAYVYLQSEDDLSARSLITCVTCGIVYNVTSPAGIGGAGIGNMSSGNFLLDLAGSGNLSGSLTLYTDNTERTVMAWTPITAEVASDSIVNDLPYYGTRTIELAAPEPSTLMLLSGAALGLMALRYRSRQRSRRKRS